MSPDEYQQAWKAESDQTRVTIDADSLLKAVQRNRQELRATISWGDFSTIGIELLLLPVFIYLGVMAGSPWTWYLVVASIVWSAAYKLARRVRRKRTPTDQGEALLTGARESLELVEQFIGSQRNDFWRTQLPCALAVMVFFVHVSWATSGNRLEALGNMAICFVLVFSIYSFTYYLSRRVIRTHYEPRRQELIALLASLGDESTGEVTGEYPMLMSAKRIDCSPRRKILGGVCAVVLLTIGIGGAILGSQLDQGFPVASPFTAVRWQESQPEVQIGDNWFKLISLDDVPSPEIVEFSQRTYGVRWQKRFEEDLVELLSIMGLAPGDEVTLVVQSLTSGETETLREVPMTRANRQAIWEAAQARQRNERAPDEVPDSRAKVDGSGAVPLAQALESIRASYKLPALAAFALRDGAIVERATVGTCTTKGKTPVMEDAQWHLGSNTKAMTATVAGMLVEEGLLKWDSTVGEVLGKAAPDMDGGHRDTTLAMLLHHTSGIAANINWFAAPEDRVACVAQMLKTPPEGQRGVYAYSNAGYVVAGAMMEVVTGKAWEDLMREKLFTPLGMKDTGFGAPTKPGSPWGHDSGLFGWKPMDPASRGSDNAPVLGPAGTVHTTMDDYARFIAAHLKGAEGKGGIVSAETFATLHAPLPGGDYGMGWIVTERGWAGGGTLTHGGSNTLWFVTVWIAPEKDMAFFAATNAGGDTAFQAVDKAVEAMIGRQIG